MAAVLLASGGVVCAGDLDEAYKALAKKDYDAAIELFRRGLAQQPQNAAALKDLAYTLLKTGDNADARDEFENALKLNPADESAALEFAFLAYETQKPIEARRMFDRLRHQGSAGTRTKAEQAFQNIDQPLAEGIARWKQALARSADSNNISMYSAHWELAQLAELRDDLPVAAEQYEICRQLKPNLSELLVVLARVWQQLNRIEDAHAALLAASRSSNSRTAELALEQMGKRYPYPYEFLNALKLDPKNTALRRELGFLYLAMGKRDEAIAQFELVLAIDPNDELTRKQLDALNGIKSRPPVAAAPAANAAPVIDAKVMGKKSLALGYTRDAIRYLRQAHEQNPDDMDVMLQLGWAYNQAHDDQDAIQWFDRARHASDSAIAAQAKKAFYNLNGDMLPQTTVWALPMYSTRWHDLFSYGQIKRSFPLPWKDLNHYLEFYLSTRFIGDLKSSTAEHVIDPAYLSETSFIFGGGVSTKTWHHLMGWAEAGEGVKYVTSRRDVGAAIPDYRGGINFAKGFGNLLGSKTPGVFYETTADFIYISRFDKDWLTYWQQRSGYTFRGLGGASMQVLFNANFTHDLKNQYWVNTVELGPGFKLRMPWMPPNVYLSTNFLRGVYTNNLYNPHRPNYNDIQIGLWYAFTK